MRKTNKPNKPSYRRIALVTIAMALLASTWTAQPSSAAVPTLDKIRVALFLHLPGKYDTTTPAATFSSQGGLSVGIREPAGEQAWFGVPADQSARFGADDYKAKLYESETFAAALAVYQYVKASGGAAFLTSIPTIGAARFQVAEGTYKTEAEAAVALARWTGDAKLTGLLGAYKPALQGPFHLETAPYGSKKDAQTAAAAFGGAGLDAFVAVRSIGEKETYSVMVGSETAQERLPAVQASAAAVPNGAALKAVAPQSRHMIIRRDHTVGGKANASHELYQFPGGGDMKVWIAPAGDAVIGLAERSNRTYRGSFELSSFNGKLAVINELPFEEYLYSVVAVEMYTSWPLEALKAQAVAARSYALNKGFGFQIAHVVDTTLSQAYFGSSVERPSSTDAVEATKGVVALYNGKVIEAIYSSSGGGMTADASEAWNNAIPYLQPVGSPDDISEAGLRSWYRVVLPSGAIGYIREDLVADTGRMTEAGSAILESTTDATNIRRHPVIQDTVPVIAQIQKGTTLIAIDKVIESNPMSWERGPFTSDELLTVMNARVSPKVTGPITSLEVGKRGPSGRATELTVNGAKLGVSSPDALRSALGYGGSLPSTKFDVEETGKVVIRGASGATSTRTDDSKKLYVMGSGGKSAAYAQDHLFVLDGKGEVRAATKTPAFAFSGTGYGHGVGLSQYGAYSLAKQGYDYEYILKYYYNGITLAKE
ncbi:SpoIID/LytB domain-containing protein [Paenibacillus sp. LHD-117]|uniref:SpoIID/LytB domain-containing protein n=1 Tax=Paenibacillus sp. LHD-117 TaxID=3071412 RepID=UPI0027E15E5A|nr:SpoIID/LytB domain-containing protein [Paenibacillus sp. LHD-117]MDQ6418605.1 SpoIID/LytB domain-containing protein [Paenibacillus sp. LHD-117]